jgi:O-antigen ligase
MIFASILFGDITSYGYMKIRDFIIIFIPTVIISFWVIKNETDWRYLGNGVLALGLYASFYTLYSSTYLTSENASYLFSGTLTALGGLVSVNRFLNEKRRKGFYFFAFCICDLGVLLCYARGQQIIYIIVLLIVLVRFIFSDGVKIQKKIILISSFFALSALVFIGYIYKLNRGEDVLWRFNSQHFMDAAELRIVLAEEAWRLFEKNPILPSAIGRYLVEKENVIFRCPHSIPLEFAAELGLFGLIYYCIIILCVFYGYLRFRQQKIIREHLNLFLFIFLCSLKQGCIYQDKAFWVWSALGLGLLGWRRTTREALLCKKTKK